MMALHGTVSVWLLKIDALTKLGLFFPVVRFIYVFYQTLAEQLYRDKGLLKKGFFGGSLKANRRNHSATKP